VLTELVPGAVWAAECVPWNAASLMRARLTAARRRAFLWNKIDVGGRSVVLRLADGSLWVHSPVALDEPLRAALAALGPVRHVVAPNFEHLKHTRAWLQAYPEATGYGCPGLREQRPELGLHADALQAPWRDEIQPLHLGFERNPFTAKPFFQELLFFHAATGTALVTDFAWNYPEEKGRLPAGSKLWKFGMDVVYGPFYRRWMVADRVACARARDVAAAWPVKALVPCHGDVLRGEEARQALLANFTPP
jgi:hypothetical protein